MHRRDFCKILAIPAASNAIPTFGRLVQSDALEFRSGFDQYIEDYALFCALPPGKRLSYALDGGKIVQAMLDNATWMPTAWGKPPALPVRGGSAGGASEAVSTRGRLCRGAQSDPGVKTLPAPGLNWSTLIRTFFIVPANS